jgi:hypothetical protein
VGRMAAEEGTTWRIRRLPLSLEGEGEEGKRQRCLAVVRVVLRRGMVGMGMEEEEERREVGWEADSSSGC